MPDGLPQIEKGTWLCDIYIYVHPCAQLLQRSIRPDGHYHFQVRVVHGTKIVSLQRADKTQKHSSRNGHRNCRQIQDKLFLSIYGLFSMSVIQIIQYTKCV